MSFISLTDENSKVRLCSINCYDEYWLNTPVRPQCMARYLIIQFLGVLSNINERLLSLIRYFTVQILGLLILAVFTLPKARGE